MTKDTALRLALEALKNSQHRFAEYGYQAMQKTIDGNKEAITAIKAALEAKDEPVAQWQKKHATKTEGKWENTNGPDAKWWLNNSVGWEIRALYTHPPQQEAKGGCQCPACKVAPHASDCAVHNEPAYPAGECNCGAKCEPVAWVYPEFWQHLENLNCGTAYRLSGIGRQPLYSAPQKQPPVIDESAAKRIATALGWQPQRKPLTVEQPEVRTGNCLRVGVCASEGHKIQPQRTWVGLTDEEIAEALGEEIDSVYMTDFRRVEAKLKEKNT